MGIDELNRMPEKEAILSDYELLGGFDRATLEEYLSRDGDITGYLFQCRHFLSTEMIGLMSVRVTDWNYALFQNFMTKRFIFIATSMPFSDLI